MPSPAPSDSADPLSAGSFAALLWRVLRGEQVDYTTGSLSRAIALLAIPMMLELGMESVFAICDIYFVGRLGDAAVATVGLSESMMTIVYAVAIGMAMSATAVVARRVGEKDVAGASLAGTQVVAAGVVAGVVLGVPCALFGDRLLAAMGASPEVLATGSGYTRLVLGANVVVMLLHLNNAVFRGAGDAMLAMKSLWLANLVNLVLDPCLIFGWGPFPELGVTGAGVATCCGRGAGVVYQLVLLRRGVGRVRLAGPALRIDPQAMWTLLRLSVGGIGQFLVATASWICLYRIVAPFGDQAVAGYTIGVRILMFTYLPAWGLSNAAATLVGQSLGAGDAVRAERAVWLTAGYNTLFLGAVMVACLTFTDELIGLFTDDAAVHAVGVDCLRIFSYGYVAYAVGMVLVQAFNGAGDTVTPTWINVVCFWIFGVPAAYLLAVGLGVGPAGVFWAAFLTESLLSLIALSWFRRGRWKTRLV